MDLLCSELIPLDRDDFEWYPEMSTAKKRKLERTSKELTEALAKEYKALERRERNRQSAKRSRARVKVKLASIEAMQMKIQVLEEMVEELRVKVIRLEENK
jgi:Basic region leucine zipper